MEFNSDGPWYYEQVYEFNYRMNDINSFRNSQIKRVNEFIKRNKIAKRYDDLLRNLPLEKPFLRKLLFFFPPIHNQIKD